MGSHLRRDIKILGMFHLLLRNALEVEKGFGMRQASQHSVEEWRRGCEDNLVSRCHYSDATIVVADQLHVGESLVFLELTESHFGILLKVIVGKAEDGIVHIEAGCGVV